MTQLEESGVSVLPDAELIETKYRRIGHIDQGKLSDKLAIYAKEKLPGALLPTRWKYDGSYKFKEKFGEGPKWSVTASYHGLFYDGDYVFRIWTDSGKKFANVDISSHLYPLLMPEVEVGPIPAGSLTKCKPMVHRCEIKSTEDVDLLINAVNRYYK